MAATILALAALAFSILSFWMIWVRRGRLLCNIPNEVGWIEMSGSVQVTLPLVFYNTGARALVVEAMELRLLQPAQRTMVWNLTRPSLAFSANDSRDFGRSFAVGGRESVEKVAQFVELDSGQGPLTAGVAFGAVVLVRFADRKYLEPVTTAVLQMPDAGIGAESIVSRPDEKALRSMRAAWQSPIRRNRIRWQMRRAQRRYARSGASAGS
jgi:hypothetical protein